MDAECPAPALPAMLACLVGASRAKHTDPNGYLQRGWKEIGPELAGKIHTWTGDMDTY